MPSAPRSLFATRWSWRDGFSLHVEGMPLLYNLLVAERRHDALGEDETKVIEHYRIDLARVGRTGGERAAVRPRDALGTRRPWGQKTTRAATPVHQELVAPDPRT